MSRSGMPLRAVAAAVLRETRAARGRLVFLTLCLAVGVAAVVGVSALIAAVEAGIRSESRSLLAADLRISSRRPLPHEEIDGALRLVDYERTELRELAGMASVPASGTRAAASRLTQLKVVDGRYPFYGTLELDPPSVTPDALDEHAVFVGGELLSALRLEIGDELSIGGAAYRVAAEVVDEPDRLDFALTLGPRVFMTARGFERTTLDSAQNRVLYTSLIRLADTTDREALEQADRRLRARMANEGSFINVRTHEDAQPSTQRSLDRVESYLGLVALLSLVLGGVGVSQIVRAWLAGRTQGVAVLRCLGLRAREIAGLYLGNVALLALAGCLAGGAFGAALPWFVREWAPELFEGDSAHLWQPAALARGVTLGLVVALVFSLPSLAAVWRVPPAAVLRAEAVPLRVPRAVRFGAPVVLFLGVLVSARVQGGSWIAAALFSAGLLVLAGLLFGGARLTMTLAARLPRGRLGPYLEHGLGALSRPGAGTTGAVVALGIGVMVVVAMLLVEQRLDHALRSAIPEDAPSVFLMDVQPDQWDDVRETMLEHGARSLDSVPVVMARLRAIDERPVSEILADGSGSGNRSNWVFTREQRLTWLEQLAPDNEVVASSADQLWSDPERAEVSLEQEFAEDLGVGLGSVLHFDVQGVPLELLVTSLRTVDWQSFGINFFLVVEPGVLDDAPHFRIAAARLEPAEAEYALQNELAATHANVTMMRIRPILEKIAGALGRLSVGVRALGSFTILSGLVILAAAVGSGAARRAREAALLKTLGVTRGGVLRLFALEYALTGVIAGTLGSAGALVLAWAFLTYGPELEADLPLLAIPLAALAAALLATSSGLAASLRALRARPLETLRG